MYNVHGSISIINVHVESSLWSGLNGASLICVVSCVYIHVHVAISTCSVND